MTTTDRLSDYRAELLARRAALVEDAAWMAETGETLTGAAARLHLTPDTVRRNLQRAGREDVLARLNANADPRRRRYGGPRGLIRPAA